MYVDDMFLGDRQWGIQIEEHIIDAGGCVSHAKCDTAIILCKISAGYIRPKGTMVHSWLQKAALKTVISS